MKKLYEDGLTEALTANWFAFQQQSNDYIDQRVALREEISTLEGALEAEEVKAIDAFSARNGGSMGKNDNERKLNAKRALQEHSEYRMTLAALVKAKNELAKVDDRLDNINRQRSADSYMMRMHAARIMATAAPVSIDAVSVVNTSGDAVSAAEAIRDLVGEDEDPVL